MRILAILTFNIDKRPVAAFLVKAIKCYIEFCVKIQVEFLIFLHRPKSHGHNPRRAIAC